MFYRDKNKIYLGVDSIGGSAIIPNNNNIILQGETTL